MKKLPMLLFALALCLVLTACGGGNSSNSGVTLADFNRIETGMTRNEVIEILGRGTEISRVDMGLGSEFVTVMYSWDGRGSLGANMSVTFQGGNVISKAQFGLR